MVYLDVVYPEEEQNSKKSHFYHLNRERERVIALAIYQNPKMQLAKQKLKMMPIIYVSHVDPPRLDQNKYDPSLMLS